MTNGSLRPLAQVRRYRRPGRSVPGSGAPGQQLSGARHWGRTGQHRGPQKRLPARHPLPRQPIRATPAPITAARQLLLVSTGQVCHVNQVIPLGRSAAAWGGVHRSGRSAIRAHLCLLAKRPWRSSPMVLACPAPAGAWRSTRDAGWSSPVARQAHNLKVAGSNPAPATNRFNVLAHKMSFAAASAGPLPVQLRALVGDPPVVP